jgi:peptide chain release factor subunit 1
MQYTPDDVMKTCTESIKDLVHTYDHESKDTFVSLYFDGRDQTFIQHRKRVIQSVLEHNELKNFLKTMKRIMTYLKKNKTANIAIFASNMHRFFEVVSLPAEVENTLIVDTSPYIRPLAEFADEWQAYTLVLLNSNHAKIFTYSCGEIAEEELSADVMNRHKKGGMSQARFQRLRKGSIHAFLSDVAKELARIAEDNIILAGPGEAKKEFYEMLPHELQKGIIGVLDVDINDEHGLLEESHEIMVEKGKETHLQLLNLIKKEILRNGLAVHGIRDTVDAVRNGQVEALLVEKDYRQRGWKCEHCQLVDIGMLALCPACGNRTAEVDVVEELIEFAENTDAVVEFTDNEDIKKVGHIAALLRYK